MMGKESGSFRFRGRLDFGFGGAPFEFVLGLATIRDGDPPMGASAAAALRNRRSIANLIEVLIRQHCAKHGISIPEQTDLSLGSDDE